MTDKDNELAEREVKNGGIYWVKRMIGDYEASEIAKENELKEAVSKRQWEEVLRLAQSLSEQRTVRLVLEFVLERFKESNQKEDL